MKKKVEVHLQAQSEPCVFGDVRNTYTKDGLFCVWVTDGPVYKFPVSHIFRVKEWLA
jgi:hypothetical protein